VLVQAATPKGVAPWSVRRLREIEISGAMR